MKHIIKSYLKSYFKNWIEAWGLIVFIIIIISCLVSTLSGTVQFTVRYNAINANSKQWDYKLASYFGFEEFKGDFLRDYYFGKDVSKYSLPNHKEAILNQVAFTQCTDPNDKTKLKGNCILKNLDKFYYDANNTLLTEYGKNYLKKYDNNFVFALYDEILNKTLDKEKDNNRQIAKYKILYEPNLIINNVTDKVETKNQTKKQLYIQSIIPKAENPNDINKVILVDKKSVMPKQTDLADPNSRIEILVGQLYAQKNNIKIGDEFIFPNLPPCKVTGHGISLRTTIEQGNGQSGGILNFSSEYGQIYMNKVDVTRIIHQSNQPSFVSTSLYLTSSDKNQPIDFKDINQRFEKVFEEPEEQIFNFTSSSVAKKIQSIRLQVILFLSIGLILLGLGFIFINFIMKKEIDKTRKQIGIFKGLGYKTSELTWVFAIKFFLTMIIGVVIGYLFSLPLQLYINKNYVNNITIPFSLIYSDWWFITLFFVVIPITFTALAYTLIFFHVKKPILQLINVNLKARNGIIKSTIKKIFNKTSFIFRMQLAFTLKSFVKWFIVCFIFMISSWLFLMSFDINPIFSSLVDNMFVTTKNDVDHIVKFNYLANAIGSKDQNNLALNLMEKYPITFTPISNKQANETELKIQAEEYNKSLQDFSQQLENSANPAEFIKLLNKIYGIQLTHRAIYLEDFIKTLKYLESVIKLQGINNAEVQFNPDEFVKKMGIINKDNKAVKPIIIINQYYYNPKQELPYLALRIYRSKPDNDNILENFNLTALQEESNWNEFFKFNDVINQKWKQIFNWQESNIVPLIISKRTSLKLGLNVNDSFDFSIRSKEKIILTGKIVAIVENETLDYNVYTDYKQIAKYYKYKDVADQFYTAITSKNKIIKNDVDFVELMKGNLVKVDMENQTFTLSISSNTLSNSTPSTIEDFLKDIKKISSLNVLNHPGNISYKNLILKFAKQGIDISINSILIIQILIVIIILIILVVIASSIIDENNDIILTFKALGYKPWQINLIVIGNYVIGIVIAYIMGYFISIFTWKLILDYVYKISDILILIPWGWQTPIKSGSIIFAILFSAWALTISLVQKKKTVVLTDQ